ncbi:MAG: hypothetical protein N3D20_01725 [Candidatus Pacearchaeota archaeon]|nr:hypothetical protein [Candidatus Pacearchaeota archaeon]
MVLLKILNKLRRKIMLLINKDYVIKKIVKRRGKCLKCGKCCIGCEYLNKKTRLCKVYKNRPNWCHKDFPIDEFDKVVFGVRNNCGYWFDEQKHL